MRYNLHLLKPDYYLNPRTYTKKDLLKDKRSQHTKNVKTVKTEQQRTSSCSADMTILDSSKTRYDFLFTVMDHLTLWKFFFFFNFLFLAL